MAITADVMQVIQHMLQQTLEATLDRKLVGLCTKTDMLAEVAALKDQFASSIAAMEARMEARFAALEEGDRPSSAGSA